LPEDAQVHEHYEMCRTIAIVVATLAVDEFAVASRVHS
jgi:hypothetical protein